MQRMRTSDLRLPKKAWIKIYWHTKSRRQISRRLMLKCAKEIEMIDRRRWRSKRQFCKNASTRRRKKCSGLFKSESSPNNLCTRCSNQKSLTIQSDLHLFINRTRQIHEVGRLISTSMSLLSSAELQPPSIPK